MGSGDAGRKGGAGVRSFIVLGGLLVLLLSAVLIAPLFVDWTAFRSDFEREASRILGQPVRVTGEAEARLLPFPSVTFTDVVVGEPDAEPMMTLERFRMDAELAPYLSGEIRIFQMTLDAPHLRVAMDEAGEQRILSLGDVGGSTVVLENVVVTDGRVSLQSRERSRSREFTGIDAVLSAQTLSGPFAGTGRLNAAGEALGFSLSSGRIEADGRWPFRLTLGSDRLALDATLDGQTILGDAQSDFDGRFELVTRPTGEGESTPEAALPPVRLTSDLALTRREARFATLRAEIGPAERPYVLTGEGRLDIADIPHFDLTLRGEQIDVDRLAGEPEAQSAGLGFAERAEAVRATLAAIPRIEIPGRVALTLPIVTAGDTTIRDLSFSGSPSGDGWTISDLRAELPGRTLVEASGLLEVYERFAFDGRVLVAAREPARFATWLAGEAPPQIASIGRAGFEARARLSDEAQILEELEVDVGGQRLLGRLERAGEPGARSVSVDLAGEAVDLDAFLSFGRLFVDAGAILEPLDALDVRFEAGPVAYDGLAADALSLDFGYFDDLLDLRGLIAEGLEGADIEARGTVAQLFTAPEPDIAAEVSAPAPARLIETLAQRWPGRIGPALVAVARDAGAVRASISAATPQEADAPAIRVTAEGTAGGTSFELESAFENGLAAIDDLARFAAEARLSSDDPAEMLRQFGLAGLDLGLPAPLTVSATLSGEGSAPIRLSASATAPGSTLEADGTLQTDGGGWGAALDVSTRSEDAAPWLTAAGAAFGQGFDGLPADLRGKLVVASDGNWTLEEARGSLAQADIASSLASRDGRIQGTVEMGALSLPWLATLVYGVSPDLPAGTGLWPEQIFAEPLLPVGGFSVALTAGRLDLGAEHALEDVEARLDAGPSNLDITGLTARLGSGLLSGGGAMANAGGFGSLRLDLSLEDANLDGGDAPVGGQLSGNLALEASGRSFAELAGSATGQGRALLADAVLNGVGRDRLQGILDTVDETEEPIEPDAVAEIVARSDEGARYELGDVETAVTVALGVARTGPVSVDAGGERVSADFAVDLRTGSVSGALGLVFTPQEHEAIPDSRPEIAYRLDPEGGWVLSSVEPLASYLSLRAYRREQERLEALREELRETVRLRREARFYRWRQAERERVEAERLAAEEERRRIEAEEAAAREREAAERAAAEREAQERAAREARERAEAAAAAAARAAEEAARAQPAPAAPLDFGLPPAGTPQNGGYQGLPGVTPLPSPLPSF